MVSYDGDLDADDVWFRYKFDAILGGAEEVLGDLGVRQALKNMPKSML